MMAPSFPLKILGLAAALLVLGCGGGGSAPAAAPSGPVSTPPGGGGGAPAPSRRYADPSREALTAAEVEDIVARAVAEATARGTPATIAVVDRLGNVLGVYIMTGARATQLIPRARNGSQQDLQGVEAPSALAAIAKAVTGAYLSSSGNAFSTRTASMIVQEHFPPTPAAAGLESGPLFGVQFSQLPCSDLSGRFVSGASPGPGPMRSPLGLSADPGGFPLYKNGVVVGGVGVAADADYGFHRDVSDRDVNLDEAIALAAASGLAAPEAIWANRISVDGALLRFSDLEETDLLRPPVLATALAALPPGTGRFSPIPGYFDAGRAIAGVAYGAEASGIRPAGAAFSDPDAYILADRLGAARYPLRGGSDGDETGGALSLEEVRTILEQAFGVMAEARAQIRQPLNSRAQVSIAVVDTRGTILGLVRSPDAPIFGIDVSVQKARSAVFVSGAFAASSLQAATRSPALAAGAPLSAAVQSVERARLALRDPSALSGRHAFSARAIGNLARPYFPDGEVGASPGAFSVAIESFSPFATGLQSALIADHVLEHVLSVVAGGPDTAAACGFLPPGPGGRQRLANGLQIFPGSVPIYRGQTLIGAVGVSGDGIDQDDMIAFLGVARASDRLNGALGHAPSPMRADQLLVNGVRLRYVNCPFSPFLSSGAQNVCQGL